MKPDYSLGDAYPWDDLIKCIDWSLFFPNTKRTNALHKHQPALSSWKSISDTWASDYTMAHFKRETCWDPVEGMHIDQEMACMKNCLGIDVDPSLVTRYWIPLQDWKQGHSLTIGDEVIYNWKAGDIYTWGNTTAHRGDNVGPHTRYLLMLTKYSKTSREPKTTP